MWNERRLHVVIATQAGLQAQTDRQTDRQTDGQTQAGRQVHVPYTM